MKRGWDRVRHGVALGVVALSCVVVLPASASAAATFSNWDSIAIPGTGPSGPADDYPSEIVVDGLGPGVTDVNVTLTNFSHTYLSDVDILLAGPGGEAVPLISDGTPSAPSCAQDVSGLTLVFDDAAASGPPNGELSSGTYKPSDTEDGGCDGAGDDYQAPAPAQTGTTLAEFNGEDPAGTWSLYVRDDGTGDTGQIAGGWTLEITADTDSDGIEDQNETARGSPTRIRQTST
jgi:subtilisin-like proprotein convertase family protein